MTEDKLTAACTRFVRNITIAQIGLSKPMPAAFVHLQATAVLSACEELLAALEATDDNHLVTHDRQVIGPAVAGLLAESQGSAPDTVPEDWT